MFRSFVRVAALALIATSVVFAQKPAGGHGR